MKAFTHKKTDKIDSEFIAQLALNKMIQPSRVFAKNQREICLKFIKHLDDEIESLEKEIFSYAYSNHNHEMELLMSVPGIGELSAAILIAEIGNFKDFFWK